MILSYCDLLGDGKRHRIKATTTIDHPASHYGQPVIVLEDGNALDLASWAMLGYQIEQATERERVDVNKIFSNLGLAAMERPELIRVSGAAESKGVSRASVYYAIAAGVLDTEKIGGTIMIIDNDKYRRWTPGKK